jgi:hypothetical protein
MAEVEKLFKCRMPKCDDRSFRFGLCLHHWDWLNGSPIANWNPRTPTGGDK